MDTPDETPALPSPPHTPIPAFEPVPRAKKRSDGWAPAVQQAFIEYLADTGSVEEACRLVGRSPASAYRLRRHPEGAGFAAAWQAAVDCGLQRIEDYAMDRAVNGVEVPYYAYGNAVATRRVINDNLAMFMLRNRMPNKYCGEAARGMSAIDRHELARLKAQWRKEWEKEEGARRLEQEKTTIESINAKIDLLRERSRLYESPRTTALREEMQERIDEAVEEDRRNNYIGWYDPEHDQYRGDRAEGDEDEEGDGEYEDGGEYDDHHPDLFDTDEEADGAGMIFNGPLALPEPDEPPEPPTGPRIRTLKDDSWR